MKWFRIAATIGLLALSACATDTVTMVQTQSVVKLDLPELDVGAVDRFNACSAEARRPLSKLEQCWITKLSVNCSRYNDCLVTCLGSPDGSNISGGCWHVCRVAHHSEPVPVQNSGELPPDWDDCEGLPDTP